MIKALNHRLKAVISNPFILQSFKTLALRVMGVMVLFGFTFFITNNYSAQIVGQFDFIRAYLLVVGTFCLLGTEQSILYFSGRLKSSGSLHELRHIYQKMAGIILMVSLLVLALVWLVGKDVINEFYGDDTSYNMIFKASALLFFNGMTILNTELFRALGYNNTSELFRNSIKYLPVIAGAIILLVINRQEYLADCYIFGFVLLGALTTAMAYYYLGKLQLNNTYRTVTLKEIVKTSYPISISGMALFLLMSIDVIFIKKYMGNEYVAYYAQAVKIMTLLSIIILTVNITISTKISELYHAGRISELKKTVNHASRLTVLLATPAAIIVCLIPETILGLFGPEYTHAATALTITVGGQWVCCYFGVVPMYLNMTQKQHYFQYILIVAVAINFVLNTILIPRYGLEGGAMAYVGSALFWNIVSAFVIYRKDKLKPFWS
jgi:O-antigen/teichoic acid export membrane protein